MTKATQQVIAELIDDADYPGATVEELAEFLAGCYHDEYLQQTEGYGDGIDLWDVDWFAVANTLIVEPCQ